MSTNQAAARIARPQDRPRISLRGWTWIAATTACMTFWWGVGDALGLW